MDNKRVLLAFVLSIGVMAIFRYEFPPAIEPVAPPPAAVATPAAPAPAVAPTPAAQNAARGATKPKEAAVAAPEDLHADRAEGIVVETELYKATIYNEGAILNSFQLKAYPDSAGHP